MFWMCCSGDDFVHINGEYMRVKVTHVVNAATFYVQLPADKSMLRIVLCMKLSVTFNYLPIFKCE